jgi:hypothetical protein
MNKLNISPEKLLKNEELIILKGGYGWSYCRKNDVACGNMPTGDCALIAVDFCNQACPGWTSIVCFGN